MGSINQGHPEINCPHVRQPILDQRCKDGVGEVRLDTWERLRETRYSDD